MNDNNDLPVPEAEQNESSQAALLEPDPLPHTIVLFSIIFVAAALIFWEFGISGAKTKKLRTEINKLVQHNRNLFSRPQYDTAVDSIKTALDIREVLQGMSPTKVTFDEPENTSDQFGQPAKFVRIETFYRPRLFPWKKPDQVVVWYHRMIRTERDLILNPAQDIPDSEWILANMANNLDK